MNKQSWRANGKKDFDGKLCPVVQKLNQLNSKPFCGTAAHNKKQAPQIIHAKNTTWQ